MATCKDAHSPPSPSMKHTYRSSITRPIWQWWDAIPWSIKYHNATPDSIQHRIYPGKQQEGRRTGSSPLNVSSSIYCQSCLILLWLKLLWWGRDQCTSNLTTTQDYPNRKRIRNRSGWWAIDPCYIFGATQNPIIMSHKSIKYLRLQWKEE